MISKKIEKAMNEQIEKEAYASSSYLSMASWCETQGLRGCAAFLYEQSAEEREHMLKLVKYINEAGGHAIVPALKQPPSDYKSLLDIFKLALEQERGVTQSIYNIVDQALSTKDFSAFNFLQWFVGEQLEEENLFTTVVDLAKMAGTDGRGLFMMDTEIRKIRATEMGKGDED